MTAEDAPVARTGRHGLLRPRPGRANTDQSLGAQNIDHQHATPSDIDPPRIDKARIRAAVTELLEAIGEDPYRTDLIDTPARVAESYAEFFAGIGEDPLQHLADAETLAVAGHLDGELVIMRGIEFRSMCEHHLLPFLGVAHIAYLPRARVVGLGKLPRVVETLAARPQLQERLTEQVADTIERGLDALGVLVVIEAAHGCVTARGARQSRSSTVTLAARGALTEPSARAEAMALIGKA